MAGQNIMCSVDTCHYWKNGNKCDANQIFVTSDSFADQAPDSIDALQASTIQSTPVNTCMDTACKTFVEKNSDQNMADGVYRL